MEVAFESHGRGVAAGIGAVSGIAVTGLFLGVFRASGGTHAVAAYSYIAFMGLAAGVSAYQASRISAAERRNRPRRIESTPLAAVVAALAYGFWAFGFNFLVQGEPVDWELVRTMTLYFMLMGAVTTWRRRQRPGKGFRYEGISFLIVFAIWLPLMLLMRKAFG